MIIKSEIYSEIEERVSPNDISLLKATFQEFIDNLIIRVPSKELKLLLLGKEINFKIIPRTKVIEKTLGGTDSKQKSKGEIPELLLLEMDLLLGDLKNKEKQEKKKENSVSTVKVSSVKQSGLKRKKKE